MNFVDKIQNVIQKKRNSTPSIRFIAYSKDGSGCVIGGNKVIYRQVSDKTLDEIEAQYGIKIKRNQKININVDI